MVTVCRTGYTEPNTGGHFHGRNSRQVRQGIRRKAVSELADAPVEALQGVSPGDAQHLKDAFNIKTVRDLGTNKYFLWAQAVAKLAD